jgi:hypothetical protein
LHAIIDSSAHIRHEIDTASSQIRTDMKLKDAQLQSNIDTASSQIRATIAIGNSNLQGQITTNATNIDRNLHAIIDSSAHIRTEVDTAKAHIRSEISALNTDITNIYATKTKVKADSNVVFDTLHIYYATKAKVKADSNVVFDTLHTYYATKSAVASQLSAYTTTADLENDYATKTEVNTNVDSVKANIRNQINALNTNVTNSYATKTTLHDDSLLLAQRLDALEAVREYSNKYIATADQTSFTLSQAPANTHLVRIYINGVMVGDNDNSNSNFPAVISVSSTIVTYYPANNGDYALRAGDRVVIYYFK